MRSQCFAIAVICLVATFVLDGCSVAPRSGSVLAYREQALVANAEQTNRLKERDFITYDPSYRERRDIFGKRLEALASELASVQASGSGHDLLDPDLPGGKLVV